MRISDWSSDVCSSDLDAARVDGEAGGLGREPLLGAGEPELVAHQVQQVGGILAVVDAEAGIEADLLGVLAQDPRADRVEGAGPGEAAGQRRQPVRSEEHTSELQSLMRISSAVFCLTKKKKSSPNKTN